MDISRTKDKTARNVQTTAQCVIQIHFVKNAVRVIWVRNAKWHVQTVSQQPDVISRLVTVSRNAGTDAAAKVVTLRALLSVCHVIEIILINACHVPPTDTALHA